MVSISVCFTTLTRAVFGRLQETLQFAEDMQIDIPNIWQYLGELIGPMVQDGCLPPISLRRICEPLSSMAGILVAEILHDMARTLVSGVRYCQRFCITEISRDTYRNMLWLFW